MTPEPVPLLLAIETATQTASLALWRDGGVVAERWTEAGRPTAESLLPATDALLADAGLALEAVAGFAVSAGPGSFTGLRIGLATVKGLAFGTGRRVAAVPTLEALARDAAGEGAVAALLDARRGELYAAGFEGGVAAAWLPEAVYPLADLAARLPEGCRVVGEGLAVCVEALVAARGEALRLQPEPAAPPARHVAELGAEAWSRGESADAETLVPRYLRRAEAEVQRTGQRFEAP